MVKVAALIPAKNEERYIELSLLALKVQNLDYILVIDDNSQDRTYERAKKFCDVVKYIGERRRLTGTPHLAKVLNFGLSHLERQGKFDYILILGADHILPKNYINFLLNRMEKNKKIAIASGCIKGERFYPDFPRGSGSLIRYSFWEKLGLRYPLIYGWESYLVYKAKSLGYLTLCYPQLISYTLRQTYKFTKGEYLGRGMKSLGYPLEYALARVFLLFFKDPLRSLDLLLGYFKEKEKADIYPFVKAYLRRRILKRLRYLL
mgnify:CR=1 FL=1